MPDAAHPRWGNTFAVLPFFFAAALNYAFEDAPQNDPSASLLPQGPYTMFILLETVLVLLLSAMLLRFVVRAKALQAENLALKTRTGKGLDAELGANPERYHGVVEQAGDLLYLLDHMGCILDLNHEASASLGYSREELLSEPFEKIDRGLGLDKISNYWHKIKGRETAEIESIHRRKDGATFFVELRLRIIVIRGKECMLVLARDVTRWKQTEESLREANTFLDSMIENLPNMVFVKDAAELRFVRFNKAGEELIGYSRKEMLGKNDYDFFPKEEADFFTAKDREVLLGRNLVEIEEERIQTRHKGSRVLRTKKIPLLDKEGNPLYLLGISEDVTERIQSEERLRELSYAMENALDGITKVGPDGYCVHANKAFASMLGFDSSEDIKHKKWTDFIYSSDFEKAMQTYNTMKESGKSEVELRAAGRENLIFHAQVMMIRIQNKGSDFLGNYLFIKNISERKYRESLEIKSDMISMVSHELRTPLHSVREGVNVMLEGLTGDLNEEQRDILSTTKVSIDRLVRLVNSVLDFQKLEAGIVEFHCNINDINAIIGEVIKGQQPMIHSKGLKLELRLDPSLPGVICDKDRIVQVITNLIANAVKFTEEGSITISTSKYEENFISIAVEDTGIGIKNDDLPKLFRKFGQLVYGSLIAPGGTGLGLAISKKIVEEHGGKLWAVSEYKKGSTFMFSLPAADITV